MKDYTIYKVTKDVTHVCVFACVCVLAAPVKSTLCNLMNCRPQNSLCSMNFPRKEYWSGFVISCLGHLPNQEEKNRFPALTEGFFIIWATKKASNTWEPLKLNYIFSAKRSIYEFRRSLPWIISELSDLLWKSLVRCSHFLTNKYWCSPMLFSPL